MKSPAVGQIFDGYRFKGGDPSDEESWEEFSSPIKGDILDGYQFKGGDPNEEKSWEAYKEPKEKGFIDRAKEKYEAWRERSYDYTDPPPKTETPEERDAAIASEREALRRMNQTDTRTEEEVARLRRINKLNPISDEDLRVLARQRVLESESASPQQDTIENRSGRYQEAYPTMSEEEAQANAGLDKRLQDRFNEKFKGEAQFNPAEDGRRIGTSYDPSHDAVRNRKEDEADAKQAELDQIRKNAEELPAPLRGLGIGFAQSLAMGGGAVAFFGDLIGSKKAQQWGMNVYSENMDVAGAARVAPQFTEIGNAKAAASWVAENAGYVAYQAAEAMISFGAGGIIGKKIGKEALAGAIVGFLNNERQTLGAVYGDAVQEAQRTGGPPPNLFQVALGATISAAVDTIADKFGFDALSAGALKGNMLRRVAEGLAKQIGVQGGTEAVQLIPEEIGANRNPFRAGMGEQYINEAAVGSLGGVGPGLVQGIRQPDDLMAGIEFDQGSIDQYARQSLNPDNAQLQQIGQQQPPNLPSAPPPAPAAPPPLTPAIPPADPVAPVSTAGPAPTVNDIINAPDHASLERAIETYVSAPTGLENDITLEEIEGYGNLGLPAGLDVSGTLPSANAGGSLGDPSSTGLLGNAGGTGGATGLLMGGSPAIPPVGSAGNAANIDPTPIIQNWDRTNRTSRAEEWMAGAAEANPAFNEVRNTDVPAHGMAKAATLTEAFNNLVSMLNGGIRDGLYTDWLSEHGETHGATGTSGGHAYRDGPFIITFRQGAEANPTAEDVTGVLVNPTNKELVPVLQQMFPNIVVRDYHNVADVVQASTTSAEYQQQRRDAVNQEHQQKTWINEAQQQENSGVTQTTQTVQAAQEGSQAPATGAEVTRYSDEDATAAELKRDFGIDVNSVANQPAAASKLPEMSRSKGKLHFSNIGVDEIRSAITDLKLPFQAVEGRNGKVVVTQIGRDGNPEKATLKLANKLRDATVGKPIRTAKPKKLTGNLRNDLGLIAPGLYQAMERKNTDGESNSSQWGDMGLIAEQLRDEGYMIPHGLEGNDLANAMRDLVQNDILNGGGTVTEQRAAQEQEAADDKKRKDDIRRLASEYNVPIRNGIVHRKFDEIAANIEQAIGSEAQVQANNFAETVDHAIKIGALTQDQATAILDVTTDWMEGDQSKDKFVKIYAEATSQVQEKIDAHEQGREEANQRPNNDQASEAGNEGSSRPEFGLETYNVEEQRRQAEQQEQDRVRAERAASAEEREANVQREIEQRSQIGADNFTLGAQVNNTAEQKKIDAKKAEDELAGQGDIFNQPPPTAKPAPTTTPPTGGVSTSEGIDPQEEYESVIDDLADDEVATIYKAAKLPNPRKNSVEQKRKILKEADQETILQIIEGYEAEFSLNNAETDPNRFNSEEDWDYKVANFPEPAETVNAIKATTGEISQDEANKQVAEWKRIAKQIGKTTDNSNKVIISLFDASGVISQPWLDAGYTVLQYDIKLGDDLIEFFPIADYTEVQEEGKTIVGVIAQPPCTTFTSTGAQWHETHHDANDRHMVEKMFGRRAARYFSKPNEYTKALVSMVDLTLDFTQPQFFMLENPNGGGGPTRIEAETGLPKPTLIFNPSNYGDPYTKRTHLWGTFNPNLPTANVNPTKGSLMHKLWSTAEKDGGQRSETPEGFAYAFFMANDPDAQKTLGIAPNTQAETPKAKPTGSAAKSDIDGKLSLMGWSKDQIAEMSDKDKAATLADGLERVKDIQVLDEVPDGLLKDEKRVYYISSGDKNAMRTLRVISRIQTTEGYRREDNYIRNLSRDEAEALSKAKLAIVNQGARFLVNRDIDLNDYERTGETREAVITPNTPKTTAEMTDEEVLIHHGLEVHQLVSKAGKTYWAVKNPAEQHTELLNKLGFASPFRMQKETYRSVFDENPTQKLAAALRNGGEIAVDPETNDVIDLRPALPKEESSKLLSKYKLEITKQGNDWVVTGKNTFKLKDAIKGAGAKWDAASKAWVFSGKEFSDDPSSILAFKIKELSNNDAAAGTGSNAEGNTESGSESVTDERHRDIREREDGRADERLAADAYFKLVSDETRGLIETGLKFGIPADVVRNQVEDVGMIAHAFEQGKPAFILANEAGTGKTFVLGGAIREMRDAGHTKFIYVTMNKDLIAQIKRDLAKYGVDDVVFHTYSEFSGSKEIDTEGAVLVFDEAHNVKNVGGGTARADRAQKLMAQTKMTIFASATPFENPVEAMYLEGTNLFAPAEGFNDWAKAYGASVKVKVFKNPYTGNIQKEEIIYWAGKGKKEDGAAARQWFIKQGVMTQRPMKLDPSMVDVSFKRNKVTDEYVDLYNKVEKIYADVLDEYMGADGRPIDNKIYSEVSRHRENAIKRVLEAAKIPAAIASAKEKLADGRNVVIFVETKSDRTLGMWRMSEFMKNDTLYTFQEVQELMTEWKMEANIAKSLGDRPPPKPFADFIVAIAAGFNREDLVHELPSTSDEIIAAFGKDDVAVYTGAVSATTATKNKADFLAGKKRVLVATMAKGGTGLSLHDTVGNRPTTQININLPWKATGVDQVAARVARYGLKSKAMIEWLFASNIDWESRKLAPKVGARMREMGAIVKGIEVKAAEILDGSFDFEGEIDAKQDSNAVIGSTTDENAPLTEAQILDTLIGQRVNVNAKISETGETHQLKNQDAVKVVKQLRDDIQSLESLRLCIGD
jgi:hypothetical protein